MPQIAMIVFALVCQPPLEESTDSQLEKSQAEAIEAMVVACERSTEFARQNLTDDANRMVRWLIHLEKGKINPKTGNRLEGDSNFFRDDSLVSFKTKKDKKEATDKVKQLILEKKQRLYALRHPAPALLLPDRGLTGFGVPIFPIEIRQVIDETSFLGKFSSSLTPDNNLYHFSNVDAERLVDGQTITIQQPLLEGDPYSYTTVTGASKKVKTYQVLSGLMWETLKERLEEIKRTRVYRNWVSTAGTTTRAELISFDLVEVKMEKEDGSIISVPIAKLSKEDQKYVQRLLGVDPL